MLLSATWPYSSYGRNTLPCELSALKETDRSALRELGEVSAATCRLLHRTLCKLPCFSHSKAPGISFLSSHSVLGSERSSVLIKY